MSLSHKLSLLTALAITLVLSIYSVTRVERELQAFEGDMRRDHRMLGHALRIAATSVASRGTPEAAVQLIEDADLDQPHITIRWRSAASLEALPERLTSAVEVDQEQEQHLVTRLPLTLAGLGDGVIELSESMSGQSEYIRDTLVRSTTATVVTIALCVLLIVVIGWFLVGKPMRAIMSQVRRIGAGDLTGRLPAGGGELGELSSELNTMCEQLDGARAAAEEQAQARLAALEQLRHVERLSTLGKLASGVAHELGTPLNVISARARMIERGESVGDEVIKDACSIHQQAGRMTRIIRQLLDFARRRHAHKEPVELRELVRCSAAMLESLAAKRGVRLEVDSSEGSFFAEVDGGQLEQVVINLVMNAIQAQPEGGVVRIGIEPTGSLEQPEVVLVVEDEGEGIDEATRERLFEPFFTTKGVGEGTGLGLSVVHGIVSDHGGRVEVDSAPGRGSRFTVTLPVGEGGARELSPRGNPQPAEGRHQGGAP